jgi:hypothetical protein
VGVGNLAIRYSKASIHIPVGFYIQVVIELEVIIAYLSWVLLQV